jgi:hypothetical protein
MHNEHQTRVRESLWRLGDTDAREPIAGATPALLRSPAVAALWMATLLVAASLLILGRVRVPHVVRATVVAVRDERDDVALMLLLPPSERRFVAVGQQATLDTGESSTVLPLASASPVLLDADRARRDFRGSAAGLIAHLDTPRLAIRLARCGAAGCLTPHVGDTFAATARLGERSLASYALSRS